MASIAISLHWSNPQWLYPQVQFASISMTSHMKCPWNPPKSQQIAMKSHETLLKPMKFPWNFQLRASRLRGAGRAFFQARPLFFRGMPSSGGGSCEVRWETQIFLFSLVQKQQGGMGRWMDYSQLSKIPPFPTWNARVSCWCLFLDFCKATYDLVKHEHERLLWWWIGLLKCCWWFDGIHRIGERENLKTRNSMGFTWFHHESLWGFLCIFPFNQSVKNWCEKPWLP